ncbi:hypothetical protein [Actinosynnema sp. NPDC023587]|uniref:hypothetical protein n=1 Tax=Actinosynnema sp. NPDC023587 TaxID=3154695 RepID=UPI0033C83803
METLISEIGVGVEIAPDDHSVAGCSSGVRGLPAPHAPDDPEREPCVQVATGRGALRAGPDVLVILAHDPDLLVRAAGLVVRGVAAGRRMGAGRPGPAGPDEGGGGARSGGGVPGGRPPRR